MITEFKDEYSWLSNFAPVDIEFDGIIYPSVEHFYVAMKTDSQSTREKIAGMEYAGQVKNYGRKLPLRDSWNSVKLTIMEYGLSVKFSQEPYKTRLLETNDIYIQEGNYWNDTFWGVDLKTGEGENHLGKLIMKIRKELK